jgi:colanic acid biosynthesis glycosyl transferase WcaI
LFYPELISTGQVVTELFERLADQLDIQVLCAQPTIVKSPICPKFSSYMGISIRRLWSTKFPKLILLGKLSNQLTYAFSVLISTLRLPRGSNIILFTDPFFLPLLFLILYPLKKFSYTIVLFDLYPGTLESNSIISKNGMLSRMLAFMYRRVYINSKDIITIGRCMQKSVIQFIPNFKNKIHYIPIWCNNDNFVHKGTRKNFPQSSKFRSQWGFDFDTFIVAYSGNLAKYHPIEDLVKTAKSLLHERKIQFLFIGEGSKKDLAIKYCESNNLSNCHFRTYVKREDLAVAFSEFDCSLVCLNKSQTGNSVLSKTIGLMSAGIPIIALVSEETETSMILKEHNCGLICPIDSPQLLSEKILQLYNDPKQRDEMSRNARSAVSESLHIKYISKHFFNVITKPNY